jgi:hypothetical protein
VDGRGRSELLTPETVSVSAERLLLATKPTSANRRSMAAFEPETDIRDGAVNCCLRSESANASLTGCVRIQLGVRTRSSEFIAKKVAPRAEVSSASRLKHLERQPALSALNDTKGVSGAVATRPLNLPEPLSTEQPRSLRERANEAMDHWYSSLSCRDRGKLNMHRSAWGRHGGTIALGLRHGKTARRHKKLKREREARLKADQAAYEARRALPASIDHRN